MKEQPKNPYDYFNGTKEVVQKAPALTILARDFKKEDSGLLRKEVKYLKEEKKKREEIIQQFQNTQEELDLSLTVNALTEEKKRLIEIPIDAIDAKIKEGDEELSHRGILYKTKKRIGKWLGLQQAS